MKKKNFIYGLCIALMILPSIFSCKKSKNPVNNSGGLIATWETTAWGQTSGDIMKFVINSGGTTGNITQLGTPTYGFSVGDVIYSSITSVSTGTYSSTGTYRYGPNNQSVGQASAILTLQNSNTVLYVHYALDASTGITPPDYYYQKQ